MYAFDNASMIVFKAEPCSLKSLWKIGKWEKSTVILSVPSGKRCALIAAARSVASGMMVRKYNPFSACF